MTREGSRRIIFNDDGDAAYPRFNPAVLEKGADALVNARLPYCVGSQVDSYFWCMNAGDLRPPEVTLPKEVGDPNRVMLDACRKEGSETFVSLRLNDTHDAFTGLTRSFKKTHPEYLIGKEGKYPDDSIMRFSWSGLDYAHEEVRNRRMQLIRDFCETYDFDGLELDFSRHPNFFKLGEEERHLTTMTSFVHRVREILSAIAEKRGKPYLLAAHVPETPALARKIGLDVPAWLADGLLDLLSAGWGYTPYGARVEEMIDLGHQHGVPVHPVINCAVLCDKTGRWVERLRGMSSVLFAKGADGVYLFNMFCVSDEGYTTPEEIYSALSEIGDPETLAGKDKLFGLIPAAKYPHIAYSSTRSALPISLVEGVPVDFFVGDDIAAEGARGGVKDVCMTTRLSNLQDDEEVIAAINGYQAEQRSRRRTDEPIMPHYPPAWDEPKDGVIIEWNVPASSLGRGVNHIAFGPGPDSRGAISTKVQEIWISVSYC